MTLMFRDKQHQFTTATNFCFKKCVQNFTEREIQKVERVCVESCVDKYLQSWDRTIQRLQQVVVPQSGELVEI